MLMCLVLGQRGQSIHMLNLESQIAFVLSKPIKKTKPGVKSVHIKFTSYSAGPTHVWSLQEYLTRTEDLRGHCKLFEALPSSVQEHH